MFRMVDLIEKKKSGGILSKEEIDDIIRQYTLGHIPDYQMSALLMAICFQGMEMSEITALTLAMRDSGDRMDLSSIEGIKVDKHSTGGVGDKTSLVLIPLVASLGVPVAKMSGRGLGHTGGTIDKLECFQGFDTALDSAAFFKQIQDYQMAITGQSPNLAPADKALYALRDVTATVDSIPLIASSIMSKKLAAGCDAIVLDVTYGSGAFMKTKEEALKLAKCMVEIGKSANKETVAVVTNMSQPLGNTVGNALEVKEAIEALSGNGPLDLMEVTYALATQMLLLSKAVATKKDAELKMKDAIESKKALNKLKELIRIQGGEISPIDNVELLPKARYLVPVYAPSSGYIASLDALIVGNVAMQLGGGRKTLEDQIDLSVGVELKRKVGDYVHQGDLIAYLHSNQENIKELEKHLLEAYRFEKVQVEAEPTIYTMIS